VGLLKPLEKIQRIAAQADQMLDLALQGEDVDAQLATPVSQAVPVERALFADDSRA
jgi:hypothetical protein